MAALPNPFMNSAAVAEHITADRAVAPSPQPPGGAAARFDHYFDPDAFLNYILIGFRERMIDDDPPPLFIGGPSDDFIEACHRDLVPLIEHHVRRAG